MSHVLLVEDDSGIVASLTLYLERSGFTVSSCRDGANAISVWEMRHPDIVILDLNLPGRKGMDICAEIRNRSSTPVIILSARDDEDAKVRSLDLGADDYIEKPFSPRELVARIRSVLKRAKPVISENHSPLGSIQYGKIVLDLDNFTTMVDGIPMKMTKTEFEILQYLIERSDTVIRRESIMHDIMGYEHYVYDRTLDTHMKNIRQKVGTACVIETVRGIGYRLK